MTENFKKTKFYIGITLVVQSITFLVLFIMLFSKKRSFAKAFLALAGVGGAMGAYLLCLERAENCEEADDCDFDCDGDWISEADEIPVEEVVDIPADETASEDEFQDR